MSSIALTGLLLGLVFGGSVLLLVAAGSGWRPPARSRADLGRLEVLLGAKARRRLLYAIGAGLVVWVTTRWPIAGGAAIALIYLWPTMFGAGKEAAAQVERLEALAVWTESLRDSIAGQIGLEQAIRHSVAAAPEVIQPPLQRLDRMIRSRIPLPAALARFAEEFDDASADLAVAALILNSRLRGPGLGDTLTALAISTREELDMRRRIEEGRKSLRRAALMLVVFTTGLAGGLAVFSRSYVHPYSTLLGEFVLAIVFAVFAAGLMWIRSAANIRAPERFLAGVDQIEAAVAHAGAAAGTTSSGLTGTGGTR